MKGSGKGGGKKGAPPSRKRGWWRKRRKTKPKGAGKGFHTVHELADPHMAIPGEYIDPPWAVDTYMDSAGWFAAIDEAGEEFDCHGEVQGRKIQCPV